MILATNAYDNASYPGKKIQLYCYFIARVFSNIFIDSHPLSHLDFFPTPVLQFCIQGSCREFLNLIDLNSPLDRGSSLSNHC